MSFKDAAIADLPTFLSTSEFGDVIDLDGDQVACVLVNDEAPGPSGDDGISLLESTLYIRASDEYKQPVVRQRVTITPAGGDARQANIIRVDEEQGMLVIRLQWFNS